MANKNLKESYPVLRTSMESLPIQRLVTVLQSGIFRSAIQGQTLLSFLSSLPGFTEDYIANRLQTIFLNGDSVDDTSLVFSEGSVTLALSAAMPGLAGALLRKGSPLTSLRKTAVQKQPSQSSSPVVVKVKLFNVIAVEKGRELLAEGVLLKSEDLVSFLKLRPTLVKAMHETTLNSEPIGPRELFANLERYPKIFLICNADDV